MRILLLLLPAITLSQTFFGQDSILKRRPYKLMVVVDQNTVYEEELKPYPYVFPNNSMQIYPGEKIFVEVEQENGVIKKISAVKENIDPAKTLVISFEQITENGKHHSMQLTIKNPFSQKLIYKTKIFL